MTWVEYAELSFVAATNRDKRVHDPFQFITGRPYFTILWCGMGKQMDPFYDPVPPHAC